jgi:hypothetical protein
MFTKQRMTQVLLYLFVQSKNPGLSLQKPLPDILGSKTAMAVALGKDQSLSVFAKAFGATYHDS